MLSPMISMWVPNDESYLPSKSNWIPERDAEWCCVPVRKWKRRISRRRFRVGRLKGTC